MSATRHRRERKLWLIAAPVVYLAAILLQIGAPHIAPYIITPHTWIWCIVGAAYHHGWLRAHREAAGTRGDQQ